MQPEETEEVREFSALLLRLAPSLEREREGASTEEIEEIEELAGRPLPGFYRWFLATMGRSMGSLASPSRRLSAETIIASYNHGLAEPESQFLLIGRDEDRVMPMLIFYDLEQPEADDALVLSRPVDGEGGQEEFTTLREMLAWSLLSRFRVYEAEQRCSGTFLGDGVDVFEQLDPVLKRYGFHPSISTGRYTGFYERSDATLLCMVPPGGTDDSYRFFDLAGPDAISLRRILGTISNDTSLEIEVSDWHPRLASWDRS